MFATQVRPVILLTVLVPWLGCQGHAGNGQPRGGADGTVTGGAGGSGGGAGRGGAMAGSGGAGGSTGGTAGVGDAGGAGGAGASSVGGSGGQADAGPSGGQADAGPSVAPPDPNCTPSKLYGRTGELWKPEGRLINAAYAGYHTGIDPIPDVAGPMKRVTDFGAKPDDMVDDSQAFLDAIAGTDGVLLIPAGRYIVSQRLEIKKSNFVLRGEGAAKTTLFFPRSLSAVYGGDFTFSGGFITVSGSDPGPVLATATANVARGATTLTVSGTAGIKVGDWVRVVQTDKGGTLFRALYGGKHPGNGAQDGGREVFHHYTRVTAAAGTTLTMERSLPFEVDTNWTPQIKAAAPTTREVGVESMTLEMAGTPYPGHFNEAGYNAIYFVGAHDSWVRDVTILNADYGVHFNRSFFCTATGVVLDTNFDRGGLIGHHGINASGGSDVLFTKFDLRKKYVHDLTVDGYMMTSVWSGGKGVDLNMDHHGRAPYGTLWTNLDVGRATRAFGSGGSGNRMPHTAAYTTVWNVYGAGPVGFPAAGFGPLMNFVGVTGTDGAGGGDDYSVENIASDKLCQKDLYEAMVAARRAARGATPRGN